MKNQLDHQRLWKNGYSIINRDGLIYANEIKMIPALHKAKNYLSLFQILQKILFEGKTSLEVCRDFYISSYKYELFMAMYKKLCIGFI